ncbi:MAG: TIGR04076 family protein [Candidatus Thorarchaeota archaeon]
MAKSYRVIAKVHELRAETGREPCPYFTLNQEFDLSNPDERKNVCKWAHHSMFPLAAVLEFGGVFPWESDPDKALVAYPDPHRIVVFELRREEKSVED